MKKLFATCLFMFVALFSFAQTNFHQVNLDDPVESDGYWHKVSKNMQVFSFSEDSIVSPYLFDEVQYVKRGKEGKKQHTLAFIIEPNHIMTKDYQELGKTLRKRFGEPSEKLSGYPDYTQGAGDMGIVQTIKEGPGLLFEIWERPEYNIIYGADYILGLAVMIDYNKNYQK